MNTKEVQLALMKLGYSVGPAGADGIPGRATTNAIIKFQSDNALRINYPGTVGPTTIAKLRELTGKLPSVVPPKIILPWMVLAEREMGLREVKGKNHNPTIIKWLEFLKAPFRDDENPWCGTFVGYMMATGLKEETLLANPWGSINWLKFGITLKEPAYGAVMVFWRGSPGSWQGHVGFYAGENKDAYYILGGNQNDSVNKTWIAKKRLRPQGIRWPHSAPPPEGGRVFLNQSGKLSTNEA